MFRLDGGRLYWLIGRRSGREAGCLRKDGRWCVRLGNRQAPLVLRYHAVWAMTHGEWPILEIDHANLNPLDDRPENLREATRSQNALNTRRRADNSSGFKGVYRYGNRGFTAQFQNKHLGCFRTSQEAHEAYCAAARMIAGKFVRYA